MIRAGSIRSVPLLALLPCLFGCGVTAPRFAPACPEIAILPDAAVLRRDDRSASADPILGARLTDIRGECRYDDGGNGVRTTLRVPFEAIRGPYFHGDTAPLTYVVAVIRDGAVIDRKRYADPVGSPSNGEAMEGVLGPIVVTVPISRGVSAAAYRIVVGLALSPAELARNRTVPPTPRVLP